MGSRLITLQHAWAVIRVDSSDAEARRAEDLVHRIAVKEVVMDQATADSEVERLNRLNSEKGAYYFSQVTRLRDGDETVIGS
jgi:hypothetical protein